jgi:hypothetical protein
VKFSITSDTSRKTFVGKIADELGSVAQSMEEKYAGLNVHLIVAFRCLPENIGRKNFRRFTKNDSSLVIDLCFSEEKYTQLSEEEQRYDLSHTFIQYLYDSIIKYKLFTECINDFMLDMKERLKSIGWLKEDWEVYI